jgi:hypothetical protein
MKPLSNAIFATGLVWPVAGRPVRSAPNLWVARSRLITRGVPLDQWYETFDRHDVLSSSPISANKNCPSHVGSPWGFILQERQQLVLGMQIQLPED